MVGFIIGGVLIGPHVLGVVPYANVSLLAELGVSLLLFAIGIELSLKKLIRVRWVSILGGSLLLLPLWAMTALLGQYFAWSGLACFALAAAAWISCTSVVLRLITDRAEVGSTHGNIITGIIVFQDIAAVPLLAIIPALTTQDSIDAGYLGQMIGKAVVFAALLYGAARLFVPMLLQAIARTKNKELFSISVLCICAGVAALSQTLGLSLALGAFVAGVIISEGDFGNQAVSEVLPLKESFGAIFFASVGMLLDPRLIMENWSWIAIAFAALILVKFLAGLIVMIIFRYPAKTSALVALYLAQMGEFSLLIITSGFEGGFLDQRTHQLVLALAVISIILTPYLVRLAPFIVNAVSFLDRLPWLSRQPSTNDFSADIPKDGSHAILCGYGPTGEIVSKRLLSSQWNVTVIDLNYRVVEGLQARGIDARYGDSSNFKVLESAGIERTNLLVLTIPDPLALRTIVSNVRKLRPDLKILARVKYDSDRMQLEQLGATKVIWEEFVAGQALALHALT
jgi:CPA2 family monovalent cation:H+ antiporter-2